MTFNNEYFLSKNIMFGIKNCWTEIIRKDFEENVQNIYTSLLTQLIFTQCMNENMSKIRGEGVITDM